MYHRAADYGSTRAMMTIALMYRYGIGVKQDSAKFEKYIRMAAKRDNSIALAVVDELESKNIARIKKIANPNHTRNRDAPPPGAS